MFNGVPNDVYTSPTTGVCVQVPVICTYIYVTVTVHMTYMCTHIHVLSLILHVMYTCRYSTKIYIYINNNIYLILMWYGCSTCVAHVHVVYT